MPDGGPPGGRGVPIAVVQAAPVAFDRGGTLKRVATWTGEAARGGARLVVSRSAAHVLMASWRDELPRCRAGARCHHYWW